VAHPDLVPVAREAFDAVLGKRPNQKERLREEVRVTRDQLLDVRIPGGRVTVSGVRGNIRVALEYIENWLEGRGAVGIANLMEDSATAEISRMQLRQWVKRGVVTDEGSRVTGELYQRLRQEEADSLIAERKAPGRMQDAARLLDRLVIGDVEEEFLTIPAYEALG
jgi:malate synthase